MLMLGVAGREAGHRIGRDDDGRDIGEVVTIVDGGGWFHYNIIG